MPNWCDIILKLEGNHDELKKFYQDNKYNKNDLNDEEDRNLEDKDFEYLSHCLTFSKLIPMPDHIYKGSIGIEEKKKYGSNNWYDWSIKNWGTKWDARDCYIVNHEELNSEYTNLEYHFLTAWSPPIPWIDKMIKKYKNIKFNINCVEESYEFAFDLNSTENGEYIINSYDPIGRMWEEHDKTNLIDFIDKYFDNYLKEKTEELFSEKNLKNLYSNMEKEIFEKDALEDDFYTDYGLDDKVILFIKSRVDHLVNCKNGLNQMEVGLDIKKLSI